MNSVSMNSMCVATSPWDLRDFSSRQTAHPPATYSQGACKAVEFPRQMSLWDDLVYPSPSLAFSVTGQYFFPSLTPCADPMPLSPAQPYLYACTPKPQWLRIGFRSDLNMRYMLDNIAPPTACLCFLYPRSAFPPLTPPKHTVPESLLAESYY